MTYPFFAKLAQYTITVLDSALSCSVYSMEVFCLRGSPNTYAISSPCITPAHLGQGEWVVRWVK